MKTKEDIRKTMEPLELLDLSKCATVGRTVEQMEKCAIGARMIGETASALTEAVSSGKHPVVIYDGKLETPLGKLLYSMVEEKKWFSKIFRSEEYEREGEKGGLVLAVGVFPERYEDAVYNKPDRTVFINNCNLVKPGQVRDGYFPDFVHGDPRFIMPIIFRTLEERLEGKTITAKQMMAELGKYGGTASQASHGFETLRLMVEDPDCTVIATFSGIMTVAKMGGLICHMIDNKMIQAISATGALMCHGFVEGVGLKHYKYNPKYSDSELADQKLNRITDCIEPEENLDQVEDILGNVLEKTIDGKEPVSPVQINRLVGEHLSQHYKEGPSILRSAFEKDIPIFIPAFADSELGNDVLVHNKKREAEGRPLITVDQEIDSRLLVKIASSAKRLGIFTLGGGVPRNYIQNVAPLIEIMNVRMNLGLTENRFFYGCRICPDLPYWGHLSGCTYSEGGSWRKTDIERGRFSEVLADATMVFPFYMAAMKEALDF